MPASESAELLAWAQRNRWLLVEHAMQSTVIRYQPTGRLYCLPDRPRDIDRCRAELELLTA